MSSERGFFYRNIPSDSIVWMMLNTFSDIVSPFAPEEILITLSGSGAVIFWTTPLAVFRLVGLGRRGGK